MAYVTKNTGEINKSIRNVTGTTSVLIDDNTLVLTGNTVLNMFALTSINVGFELRVINRGGYTLTMNGNGSDLINGSASYTPVGAGVLELKATALLVWDAEFAPGGNGDLASTLVLGNISGANDIVMSNGQQISAASGASNLDLRADGVNSNFSLTSDAPGTYGEAWIWGTPSTAQLGFGSGLTLNGGGFYADSGGTGSYLNASSTTQGSYITYNGIGTTMNVDALLDPTILKTRSVSVTDASCSGQIQYAMFLNTGGGFGGASTIAQGTDNVVVAGGAGIIADTSNTLYTNKISLKLSGAINNMFIVPPATTANRTATLQDASGTIAYTTDIPNAAGTTTETGNALAVATTISTYTIVAGTIPTTGRYLTMTTNGIFAANVNLKQLTVSLGASQIFDSTAQIQSGGSWELAIKIVNFGTSSKCVVSARYSNVVTLFSDITEYSEVAQDLATNKIITVVATGVANNDIVSKIMTVQL